METRANHIMIGIFAIGVTLLAFLFVLVLAKYQFAAQYAYYIVKFSDSVSGLPLGGEVRYNGVKVGTVEDIRFVPSEPKIVNVLVKIENREDFALREDSQASLQFLGITGLTYVQITGSTSTSPKLPVVTNKKGKVPVIVAQASTISQLVEAIPELLSKAEMTFDRINAILDTENQERISKIIANLAAGSDDFRSALKNLNKLSKDADSFLNSDAKQTARQLTEAARSIGNAADIGDQILTENRQAINDFTVQGLSQLATFVVEARQLVATLDRIAQQVESDPTGFVLGGSRGKEVEVHK